MAESVDARDVIERAGADLFDYAVDREDVKVLLARLPESAGVAAGKVEYELQILKIVLVGWAISFFLENSEGKEPLMLSYWEAIRGFSEGISSTTGLMIGREIDYFQILKDRLDTYIDALNRHVRAPEPAAVIGPEFAAACGDRDDVFAVMTGSRMCIGTLDSVRRYLEGMPL